MEYLKRHSIKGYDYEEGYVRFKTRFGNNNPNVVANIKQWKLDGYANSYIEHYCESELLNEREWSEKYLYYASELCRLIYLLSNNIDKEVLVEYEHQSLKIEGWQTSSDVTYPNLWIDRLDLALVTRNENLKKELSKADYIKGYGNEVEISELQMNYRRDILLGKPQEVCLASVKKAIEYQEEGLVLKVTDPYGYEYILTPVDLCYEALLIGDESLLNQRLEDALKKHYIYSYEKNGYTGTDVKYHYRTHTWISFRLLAICCQAYDKGMNIRVASDYIPEWLIKKEFQYELKNLIS